MVQHKLPYISIGNTDLTHSRGERDMECASGGKLNDYVPFYFGPRSVMLYLIHQRHQSTYGGGQEPVIYLVSALETISKAGIPFAFTDRNALMRTRKISDDVEQLDSVVDWEVVNSTTWANTDADPDRKERKQAELLAYRFVPWKCIVGIGVYNESFRKHVATELKRFEDETPIQIKTGWYY